MTARSAKPPTARGAPRQPAPVRSPRRPGSRVPRGPRGLFERAKGTWDRPLTAYYLVLGGSLLITALGLVMVFSASQIQALQSGLSSTYFFSKQLIAAVLGTVLLLIGSRTPVRLHRALAYPLLLVSIVLMCLVQVPGIGQEVNGNQNWIYLGGPFQLQPSEFAKLALVLWGADLLARKSEKNMLTQWKHMLVPLVPMALLLLGLIMLGGDMGTALILTAVLFGLLWLAGAPTRLFAGVFAAALAAGAFLVLTNPNRLSRLGCIGATDPGTNDQCWQAVHGIYALASGGWFGSGLGASVEKWGQLPEPHTDFIFAVTGEELGLAGTLSVLALFAALGYAGIRVAGRTEDPFVRFAAGGVTTWITAQAVINVGAVLGLLPIAGVPLPLFSYGGSALLPTMFAVGLLIAFARSDPAARAALAQRPASGRRGPRGGTAGVLRIPGGASGRKREKTMRRRTSRPPSGER
ncbi:putative lipid II flippase FtsW [Streptomyces sp. NRRL S-1868]|uniref:putative lipid II flippase FtsW n=1 Tax=Streptomyces sp. NRRL S-1868 TaxID=1463892 RepID=UPI0004C5AED2|nr:putative lipid II flippase FtsW [Streptomyces sp. NRRL S-1868]